MDNCLTNETLGALADATVSPRERQAALAHMADCPDCQLRWVALAAGPVRAPARAPAHRPALAAAILLVCAVAAAVFLRPPSSDAPPNFLPTGREITGQDESLIVAEALPPQSFSLPDGSRLRLHPGSAARFVPPGPGDRFTVELARGTLDAQIEKGDGAVSVVSEAGQIRVLGTRFTARASKIYRPESSASGPEKEGDVTLNPRDSALFFLSVEVEHGRVVLRPRSARDAQRSTLLVPAGWRGLLWTETAGDARAILQEAKPIDWEATLLRWDGASPAGAVFLLGSAWEGAADWRATLKRSDLAHPLKARLERLKRIQEPEVSQKENEK